MTSTVSSGRLLVRLTTVSFALSATAPGTAAAVGLAVALFSTYS